MDIKIFVSHRVDLDAETIDNSIFIPIKSGLALAEDTNCAMIGDNTGDNISNKNTSFCELTTQYWAWKNIKADYYGLCHYRRYLNFSDNKYDTDVYGNVCDNVISKDTINKYGLTEEKISSTLKDYDIITSTSVNVARFPEHFRSIYNQYDAADNLHGRDLDVLLEVIKEKYPNYEESAKKYLRGKRGIFCNLFVMKKAVFFDYCEWLFNILFEVEKRIDMSTYTIEGYRTLGHLGERLLGIYILYNSSKTANVKIKVKELQPVLFKNPIKQYTYLQASFTNKKDTIPVVFAANDFFAPMCATTIASLLSNSDSARNYDIVVLNKDISTKNKSLMKDMCSQYKNVSLRFFDVISLLDRYSLKGDMHISVETYYRFLIQDILKDYDKVLYLDSDLICLHNLANLYDINIDNYWLAAIKDPDMIGQVNKSKDYHDYTTNTLTLKNPYSYFQAGVLLLNTKLLRENYTTQQWLEESMTKYKYMDQDILNKNAQNNVKYLDMRWNVLTDCAGKRISIIKQAPYYIYKEYMASRKTPFIIHYAGFQKPWNDVKCDFFVEFWQYAKLTPFYEILLNLLYGQQWEKKKEKKFVSFCKTHCPKWLRPFAMRVKRFFRL